MFDIDLLDWFNGRVLISALYIIYFPNIISQTLYISNIVYYFQYFIFEYVDIISNFYYLATYIVGCIICHICQLFYTVLFMGKSNVHLWILWLKFHKHMKFLNFLKLVNYF